MRTHLHLYTWSQAAAEVEVGLLGLLDRSVIPQVGAEAEAEAGFLWRGAELEPEPGLRAGAAPAPLSRKTKQGNSCKSVRLLPAN